MLLGSRTVLRAVELADYPLIARWLNDPAVMKFWGRAGDTLSVADVSDVESAERVRGNSRKYIIDTLDGRSIGQIDYYDLNWQSRSAWTSILVADTDYWGGGYGTEAMRTLLHYLFAQMGLHRVCLTVHESNVRAQRSYAKNGFVKEGLLRDWAYFDGRWENGVLMAVLAPEFETAVASTSESTHSSTSANKSL